MCFRPTRVTTTPFQQLSFAAKEPQKQASKHFKGKRRTVKNRRYHNDATVDCCIVKRVAAIVNKHNGVAIIDKHNGVAIINKRTTVAMINKHNRHHRIF
jgi:hypothetical protein